MGSAALRCAAVAAAVVGAGAQSPPNAAADAVSIPRFLFTSHKLPLEQMPDALKRNIDTWRRLNPTFAFRYFDDEAQAAFMHATCAVPRCVEAYDALVSGAGKADLFRMAWLYYRGGWWFDADLRPGPIAESCDLPGAMERLFLVSERHGLLRFMIIAGHGHPFLKFTLAKQIGNIFKNLARPPRLQTTTLTVTGPVTLSQTICETALLPLHDPQLHLGPHCRKGRFEGFTQGAPATSIQRRPAGTFGADTDLSFRMDKCQGAWFVPFADFNHKKELRKMNLTHYSMLATA